MRKKPLDAEMARSFYKKACEEDEDEYSCRWLQAGEES